MLGDSLIQMLGVKTLGSGPVSVVRQITFWSPTRCSQEKTPALAALPIRSSVSCWWGIEAWGMLASLVALSATHHIRYASPNVPSPRMETTCRVASPWIALPALRHANAHAMSVVPRSTASHRVLVV
jgi:hypothetical protein